jgi:bifunctional enzyme CysN/CysC
MTAASPAIRSETTVPARAEDDAQPTPIVIVGHVDHGKSTLLGRLLHDTDNLLAGKLEAARQSSEKRGLGIEWSFLLDSLQAERDQGVTIDATRLPFTLEGREFVIIDAPGHRQFLRNMITGAAGASAAVLVVDVAEGVRDQTRRHAMLLHLIGIRQVIVVLNKVDLLGFAREPIETAAASLSALLAKLEITPRAVIPVSARHGDMIATRSPHLAWFDGPTLTEALAALPRPHALDAGPLRLPVQDVYRQGERRYVVGRIESGRLAAGETVAIGIAGHRARITALAGWPTPPAQVAGAGQSIALELAPEVVVTRGDLVYHPSDAPLRARRLAARVFWLRQEPLRLGENFHLRLATAEYKVRVTAIERVVRIDDLSVEAGREVPPEGFADITLTAAEEVLFDPFRADGAGAGGRGVLVDAYQHIVGGAPILGVAGGRENVFPLDAAISHGARAAAKGYRGAVFWLTGLPGAGKSTLAREAERRLFADGIDAVVLDGDTLRSGLNADLGFSPREREENVRRTAEVARIMAEAGMVVLVALISPQAEMRAEARRINGVLFHEIYIAADASTCEARDPKGLYAKARAGTLLGFTGTDGSYEAPDQPDLRLDTENLAINEAAERLVAFVAEAIAPPSSGDADASGASRSAVEACP